MFSQKNINILGILLIFCSLVLAPLFVQGGIVSAEHKRCFTRLQGGNESFLAVCPDPLPGTAAPGGQSPDASKCYSLNGPQLRATSTTETSCSSANFSDPEHGGANPTESTDAAQGVSLEANCEEDGPDLNDTAIDAEDCGIIGYIVMFTRVLSGLVGIVVVVMIAVGGIQYTTARDDPQGVAAARTRIRNAVLALVFYLVSVAFLQWLVPGGIF